MTGYITYQLMHTVLSFQRLVGLAVVGGVHRILDVCCVLLANLQKKKELLLGKCYYQLLPAAQPICAIPVLDGGNWDVRGATEFVKKTASILRVDSTNYQRL